METGFEDLSSKSYHSFKEKRTKHQKQSFYSVYKRLYVRGWIQENCPKTNRNFQISSVSNFYTAFLAQMENVLKKLNLSDIQIKKGVVATLDNVPK